MTSESQELQPSLQLPKWRYFVALVIVGSYPLVSSLSLKIRGGPTQTETALFPTTVPKLLQFTLLQMAIFGAFWGLSWAFSRYNKSQLFLEWKDGVKPIIQGILYYMSLYVGFLLLMSFLIMILLLTGKKDTDIIQSFQQFRPQTDGLTNSIASNQTPLYRILILTLIPFVVAGLREELWRGATLVGLKYICPASWSQPMRNVFAIIISSVIFGLGHLYQGPSGIVVTGILGLGLGYIILKHDSIWPAVITHGLIDAVSFALASYGAVKH